MAHYQIETCGQTVNGEWACNTLQELKQHLRERFFSYTLIKYEFI
jgi:hypothetical protein